MRPSIFFAGLGGLFTAIGLVFAGPAIGDVKSTTHAQSLDLARQKVQTVDLEARVHQLEVDLDRIAPHTGVVLPPRVP